MPAACCAAWLRGVPLWGILAAGTIDQKPRNLSTDAVDAAEAGPAP
ncbi:hypothetical protein [Lacisediminihabitans sp. H27-G8]